MLATNAWAADVRELHRRLVVVTSDMIATAPVPERLEEIGWTGGECISDSQIQIHYYHATRDGRVAFGKGGWGIALAGRITRASTATPTAPTGRAHFRRLYPAPADSRSSTTGRGRSTAVGRATDLRPPGGREHIVYGVGWSGNGVAPSQSAGASWPASRWGATTSGRARPLDGSTRPSARALRFLGAHVVREAVVRTERAHEAGRVPNALVRAVAGLAPAGIIPKAGEITDETAPGHCPFRPIPSVVEMRTHDEVRSGTMQEFEVRYEGELPAAPAQSGTRSPSTPTAGCGRSPTSRAWAAPSPG